MSLAAWKIGMAAPERLVQGRVELERHLEDWIAHDPGLVDRGLLVVQRQLHVEGGYLDLLCVDLQGRAVVVEIKRGKLIRDTIAQALDYASSIANLSTSTLRQAIRAYVGDTTEHPGLAALLDETDDSGREVEVVVVGIGAEPGLQRMIDFLGTGYSVPIRAVIFDVFALGDGGQVLIREEKEPESAPDGRRQQARYTRESVIELAGGPESARGRRMLHIVAAVERHGLNARPYKYSFMFTPPSTRTRYLMLIRLHGAGDELRVTYSAEAFAEFFPLEPEEVRAILGHEERHVIIASDGDVADWVDRLDALFATIEQERGPDSEVD
jgi:hypothetical protein